MLPWKGTLDQVLGNMGGPSYRERFMYFRTAVIQTTSEDIASTQSNQQYTWKRDLQNQC